MANDKLEKTVHEYDKDALNYCTATLAKVAGSPISFKSNYLPDRKLVKNIHLAPLVVPVDSPYNHLSRGLADQWGLSLRFHDRLLHQTNRPVADIGVFVDQMEKTRILCLAAQWPGIANNISDLLEAVYEGDDLITADVCSLLICENLAPGLIPLSLSIKLAAFRQQLAPIIDSLLVDFTDAKLDQLAWLNTSIELAHRLNIPQQEPSQPEAPDPESGGDDELPEEAQQAGFSQEEDDSVDEDNEPELSPPQPMPEDDKTSDDEKADVQLSLTDAEAARPESTGQIMSLADYTVYSRDYDEVIEAAHLCDRKETLRLRQLLDRHLQHTSEVVTKLAANLQRRLMAQHIRYQSSSAEGILNTQRLAQVVANPFYQDIYQHQHEYPQKDTAITLLIDNSGSMRGRSIRMAAMCADILGQTLQRCQVKLEILGFTTRSWKGGQVKLDWQADKEPINPGRMNELRHIVYKSFSSNFQRSRIQLGLMLRESLLKENIDGEALLWAYQRLLKQPVKRRILLVISDGAPVDDSTLNHNNKSYLEQHLRTVIKHLEQVAGIELLAIGIGHDVRDYYQHAVMLTDPAKLGEVMLTELSLLLDKSS